MMKKNKILYLIGFLLLFFFCLSLSAQEDQQVFASRLTALPDEVANKQWVLVIHGGAGGPPKENMPVEIQNQYIFKLNEGLQLGSDILKHGGSSLDAVVAVVRFMEDCPLFNAGKGAVLDIHGVAELDASVMDGKTGMAGAVAGVTTIRNPVLAAKAVMENTRHVLLVGEGADQFAAKHGLEIVDPSYFITPSRKEAWKKAKDEIKGTVGAVALDLNGNLAAATSTGGMMNKIKGRVGDTPIIGAGTYARNGMCAVSCTGHGEYFMRLMVAYDVSALMMYKGMSLEDAASFEIMEKLKSLGADGGLIAVDYAGNIAFPYNTNAMFRGFVKSSGEKSLNIFE